MADINDPNFKRIVSDYNIQLNPNWDNKQTIQHVRSELQKLLAGTPDKPISLADGMPKMEVSKPKEPTKGFAGTFWDNFPVRRTLSEAAEGLIRSVENIPYSLSLLGTDPTNIKKERQLEKDMFPVSQPLSEFNMEWAAEDAAKTAEVDKMLEGLSLSEKVFTPQWYAKHLGQTSARIVPEVLSLLITKKPLSVGAALRKATTKSGAKQLAKESTKDYLFNPTQIGARIAMNAAIEATQTRQEAYQMAIQQGMDEESAIAFANRASRSANAMNALIYGVSDTASRFLVAPQIIKGLSQAGKGKIAKGAWKATSGVGKNWLIETFLEEIPQSEVLRLSLETAGGGEVNLFDVYGPDTYKDVFSSPAKREIMAITAFMSPLMSVPDVVAAFKGEPSNSKSFDNQEATAPDMSTDEILQLPAPALLEFNPSQEQLVELSKDPEKFRAYTVSRTKSFIANNFELGSLSEPEQDVVINHVLAQSEPAAVLDTLQKGKAAMIAQGADQEVIADIDKQIDTARGWLIEQESKGNPNAEMFYDEYDKIVDNKLKNINEAERAFSRLIAKTEMLDQDKTNKIQELMRGYVREAQLNANRVASKAKPVAELDLDSVQTMTDEEIEAELKKLREPEGKDVFDIAAPTVSDADAIEAEIKLDERRASKKQMRPASLQEQIAESDKDKDLIALEEELSSIDDALALLSDEDIAVRKKKIVELAERLDGIDEAWDILPPSLDPGGFIDYGSGSQQMEIKFSDMIREQLYGKNSDNIGVWEDSTEQNLTSPEVTADEVQAVEPQIDEQQVAQPTQETLTENQIAAKVDEIKKIENFNELKKAVRAVVPKNVKIPNNKNGYIRAYKNHLELQAEKVNFQAIKQGEKISKEQRKQLKDFIKDNGFIANDSDMKSVLKEMGAKAGRIRPLVKNAGNLSWDQMAKTLADAGFLSDPSIAPDEFINWLDSALTAPKKTAAPKRKSAQAPKKVKPKPPTKKKKPAKPKGPTLEEFLDMMESELPPADTDQFQFSYTEREGKPAILSDIKSNIKRMLPDGSTMTDTGADLQVTLPNGASFTIHKDLDNIPGDAVGAWDTRNMIMFLSGRSDQFTADHEYMHTAEQLVLSKDQRNFLREKLGDVEKTADAYAEWIAKRRKNFDNSITKIFEQIKDFFAKFANMLNIKTKQNIFNVVREGKQLGDTEYTIAESFLFSKREPKKIHERPSDKKFEDKIKVVREKAGAEFDQQAEAKAAQQAVKEAEAAQKEILAEMQRDIDFIEGIEKGLEKQRSLTVYRQYLLNLQKENRGKNNLLSKFRRIAEAVRKATKQKRLEEAKALVDQAIKEEIKDKKVAAIMRIANWANPKTKDGRLQQKNLPFEVNQELEPILYALSLNSNDVDSRLKDLYEKIENNTATESDRNEIDALEVWGDIENKSLEEVEGLLKSIKDIYRAGRRKIDRDRAMFKAESQFVASIANKELGGLKSEEAAAAEKAEKSAFRRFRDQPTFVNFAESLVAGFPELMEKAFGRKSIIAKTINNLVSKTSLEEIKQKNDWLNERNEAFNKIFKITGNRLSKPAKVVMQQFKMQREMNPKDHDVTINDDGKRVKLAKLSMAQAYRMWQIMESKDVNTKQAAKNSGYDAKTKKSLDDLMKKNPEIKAWAEYEVKVMYPKFWNDFIVPRYIERYNVEPPKVTGGYVPLEYSFEQTMDDLVKNGVNPIKARATTGNLIQRKKNSMKLKRSDGLMLLQNYLENNINVMTWTGTLRKLDSIFDSDRLKAIEQKRGKDTKEAIQQHLKVLKIGNPEQVVMRTGFERMFHNVSVHFLGLNIASGFKNTIQASNWGMAYDSFADWTKWQGRWGRAYKEIKENPELMSYLKTRFFDGSDIFMRTSMNALSKFRGSPFGAFMALTKKLAYSPIQMGDAFATSFGIPYYSYRLDYYKKQGFSIPEAKAKAGADFAQAVERYQSPTLMENTPSMHLKGASFTKFATMMSTGLLPAARQMLGGIRRLTVGEERFDALRDLSFALLALPFAYTAMETFVNIVRGQEDDEEKYWQRFALNSLASPMSTLPITGPVVNSLGNVILLGHNYGKGVELMPALSPINKLVKESAKWSRKTNPTKEDDERWFKAVMETGAAYGGIPRQYKYLMDD